MTIVLLLYVVALHCSIAGMEILSWLLVAIFAVSVVRRKRSFTPYPAWIPVLGLVLCTLISLLLNPGGRGFWFQFGFLRWAVLLYVFPIVLAELWSEKFEKKLLYVWSGAMLITGAYAIIQSRTGIDLIRPAQHVVSYQGGGFWRPTGFFNRSLEFAYSFGFSFLALSLPVARLKPKLTKWFVLAVGTLTLILTESRGAWLGLVGAVLAYLILARKKSQLLIAAVAIVLAGAWALHTHSALQEKVKTLVTMHFDHSESVRTHLWRGYFAMWRDKPFFGVGIFNGDLLLPTYYKRLGIQETFYSHAHNVYLQWLAGAGVFALFFYLCLCFYFLRLAWRLRDKTPWGWSLLLAQIFVHIGALTEANFFTMIVNHMIIFGWALLLALNHYYKAKEVPI